MESQNQDVAQSSKSGGTKWTSQEENFLVIQSMDPTISNDWLFKNMPGSNGRTLNSIAGHFGDMRLKKRLAKSWRTKTWDHSTPWTIEEDAEILQWHVSGRACLDAQIFYANDRAGGAVLEREVYLCEDTELVETVARIEERLRLILLEHDMINADSDRIIMRHAAIELRREESHGIDEIFTAIKDSLRNRDG
ncbi:hypothetical protein LOZ58_002910 [Ophidiomyces ophidiicola]|nr:hypothetical protein LOZ58_002910 [Ophidiomyces ophidiicola]